MAGMGTPFSGPRSPKTCQKLSGTSGIIPANCRNSAAKTMQPFSETQFSAVRIHQLPPQKPRRINVLRGFLFLDHVLDPTPSGYLFQNTFMDDYLKEWEVRKRELLGKTISPEEYTAWKLQWPCSCDSCGKCEAQNQWRVLQSLQRDTKEWASQRSHLLCTLNTR